MSIKASAQDIRDPAKDFPLLRGFAFIALVILFHQLPQISRKIRQKAPFLSNRTLILLCRALTTGHTEALTRVNIKRKVKTVIGEPYLLLGSESEIKDNDTNLPYNPCFGGKGRTINIMIVEKNMSGVEWYRDMSVDNSTVRL